MASTDRRSSIDAVTAQAIVHRESIAKNYVPIVHPEIYLPMLQLRKDGDCEVGDPRACLHHYNSAADLACVVFTGISLPYFNAMVKAGYIAHGLRVILGCTENDEYDERIVVRKQDGDGPSEESVEDMLHKYKTKQGTCRPGVELINLDAGYEFKELQVRKRGRGPTGGPAASSTVRSRYQFLRKAAEERRLHECRRKLQTDEAARSLASGGGCRKDPTPDSQVSVPTLIIYAAWCFPGHEHRRKQYGYRV